MSSLWVMGDRRPAGIMCCVASLLQEGLTPLIAATKAGSLETVKLLLEMGAKLNVKLLVRAVTAYMRARVRCLPVSHSAMQLLPFTQTSMASTSVDTLHKASGGTALHSAAYSGNVAVMRVLIDAGADLESRDKVGSSCFCVVLPSGWSHMQASPSFHPGALCSTTPLHS